ncbi:hypothetical protein I5R43_31075 [Pseudomonas aeruginosa]|nr:hypothetical protein [Pseudomonas aeruginosa]MBG6903158.1 hypothetical protein [Pseudomonas aeruginosa]MBH4391099.1 hypothetical protein [Pseudomonas aeruginosa]
MPVFEVVSGGDRRSLMKRFERKSKQQAISELVDFHLLNCDRIEKLEAERDAALARVAELESKLAELEKQEPVALANRGNQCFWVKWTEAAAGLYGPGIKLYAAPVAQAQHSVPEVSGIGRDFAYPRSVVLYLRTEPTDDDLRAIHDGLLSLAAAPGKEGNDD